MSVYFLVKLFESDGLKRFLDNGPVVGRVNFHARLDGIEAVVDKLFIDDAYKITLTRRFSQVLVVVGSHLEWFITQPNDRD